MKPLFVSLGWLFVALGLAGSLGGAEVEAAARLRERLDSGVLTFGGDEEGGAPYVLIDPIDPTRRIGFEVELADALVAELSKLCGRPIRAQFVQYDWGALVPGLDKHDFDVILNGFEVNAHDQGHVLLSRPYYKFAQQLVVRADEAQIDTLADCVQRPVATLAGSASERLLQRAGIRTIVGFEGQVEPYLDLEIGRVDAVVLDEPIYLYYAAPNPKLRAQGAPLDPSAYAIGLRLNDTVLAGALNEALSQLMQSGRLRDIYRKWHLWNAAQSQLAQGEQRVAELHGLGFDDQGKIVDEQTLPRVESVDRAFIAASAEQWTFDRYAPELLRASLMTVVLTLCSMALAVSWGLLVAVCRLYAPLPLRYIALGYVEFFRGVPLLLVLSFIYFGVAPKIDDWLAASGLNWHMSAVWCAIVGFGLTYAAYESEIYRSAIESVPRGQWEAGRALGMPEPLVFRRIVLPQAMRTALGPMTNDFVALFKDTSLVSVIAVRELTKEYLVLARSSYKFVELGLLTAALYLIMSVPLGYLSRSLERRWGPKR